ncbi:MAG: hypothetical protein ACKN9W_13665 [Methylococcus sp.]
MPHEKVTLPDGRVTLYQGDCLELFAAVITDPLPPSSGDNLLPSRMRGKELDTQLTQDEQKRLGK